MKNIIYKIIFLSLFPFVSIGQSDSSIVSDTIVSEEVIFFNSLTKIEFVKVDPICKKQKRYIDSLGRKKKVNICHAESVLNCIEIAGELKCDINLLRLSGKVEIDKMDFDELFRIIYKSEKANYLTTCYNPRHGILFYGENNEQIGFIEICFECEVSFSTPAIPDFGLLSNEAYEELQVLFKKYGFNLFKPK